MNNIKNLPTEIFLNIGTDEEADFKQLREVTWSANRVHDSDIRYVLDAPQPEVMSLEEMAHEECKQNSHSPFTAFIAGASKFRNLASHWEMEYRFLNAEYNSYKKHYAVIEQSNEKYVKLIDSLIDTEANTNWKAKADQLEAENERLRSQMPQWIKITQNSKLPKPGLYWTCSRKKNIIATTEVRYGMYPAEQDNFRKRYSWYAEIIVAAPEALQQEPKQGGRNE